MFTNTKTFHIAVMSLLIATGATRAEPGDHHHGHDHQHEPAGARIAGPHGGRILEQVEPHLEFFVDENRHLQLTPLDHLGQPAPLTGQTAMLYGGDRQNPLRMRFTQSDHQTLISDSALPAGQYFPVVLRIGSGISDEQTTVRLNVNLEPCSSCDYAEYACICGH